MLIHRLHDLVISSHPNSEAFDIDRHHAKYFFNPLNRSFAPSNTSSSLHIANRNQSSAKYAFLSV